MEKRDFIVVGVIAAIILALVILIKYWSPHEVSYQIEVKKVDYAFPILNVTLLFHEKTPEIAEYSVLYKGRVIAHQTFTPIEFDKGDRLILTMNLDEEPQESLTLTLRLHFGRHYQDFTIQIPQ
jgi:hypothetical protein